MGSNYRNPKAVATQRSMLPDVGEKVLGDNRDKIWKVYQRIPEVAQNDTLLQLAFWEEFDGLKQVLGDRYDAWVEWYLHHATDAESIRRSRQSLTEHGILPQREEIRQKRAWKAGMWKKYWGQNR